MHEYRVKSSHPLESVEFSGIREDGEAWSARGLIQVGGNLEPRGNIGTVRLWAMTEIGVEEVQ